MEVLELSPFLSMVTELGGCELIQVRRKCCLLRVLHSGNRSLCGRAGKWAQAASSPGSPDSPMEILPSKRTS